MNREFQHGEKAVGPTHGLSMIVVSYFEYGLRKICLMNLIMFLNTFS